MMPHLLSIFSKRQLVYYLSLAILIRLLIMPFFFHPDIKTYHFQSSFLQQGVINIYQYLDIHKLELPFKEEFIYFPLTYLFLGSYQWLVSPILGSGFHLWLFNAEVSATLTSNIYGYLFILKLPYLILDLLVAFILTKLVTDETDKKVVFLAWLFNPFSILIIYVFSNVDLFPVLFSLLSLYFAQKNRWLWAGVMLGVGAGFKAYPLLFLPFLVLAAPNTKSKLKSLLGGLLTVILIVLPFISSQSFRESTLTSGLMTRIVNLSVGLGFGESIIFGFVGLALVFFWGYLNEVKKTELWRYYLAVLLVLFSVIHFHIQWILWVLPFLLLIKDKKLITLSSLLSIVLVVIPFLYDDKFMSVSLLTPISEDLSLLPIPFGVLNKIYQPYLVQSVLHSMLAAIAAILSFRLMVKNDD